MKRNPFRDARKAGETPMWLLNGMDERAEAEAHEAEHRRRLGMAPALPAEHDGDAEQ